LCASLTSCHLSTPATFPRTTETEALGSVKTVSENAWSVVAIGGLSGSGWLFGPSLTQAYCSLPNVTNVTAPQNELSWPAESAKARRTVCALFSSSDVTDQEGHALITAYALKRPDGQWSLMLINKDFDHAHDVRIVFNNLEERHRPFAGSVTVTTFGKGQYQWHPNRKQGYADPDNPPVTSTVSSDESTQYTLPPASLNIIRGNIAGEER